ncbi:MAG: polysaccharide export protein [Verrucomicrobiae bacterium]|nr:polysaccharide export protein [Verrucomicrobiae bacterium]
MMNVPPRPSQLVNRIAFGSGECLPAQVACASRAGETPPSVSRASGATRPGRWRLAVKYLSWLAGISLVAAQPKFTDISHLFPEWTSTPATEVTSGLTETTALTSNTLAAATTGSMDALDDKYILAIGDRLSFRIVEDEDDPKPLFVTDSGELEVPYIGRFPGVGKTCQKLAREIKAELEKEYYYQATVILAVDLMTRSRGKVYLVGPVRMPGPQEIPSDEVLTLSKAILRAGGFNDFADRRNVKVTRKTGVADAADQTFTVDVAEILEKGRSTADLPLQPGDLIYIPERLIRF